jgi:hypothetical protein
LHGPSQVCRSGFEAGELFFEEPNGGVTCVAQQAAHSLAFVVVIDTQMMKKLVFIARAFCRLTAFPELATNRAAATLRGEDPLHSF